MGVILHIHILILDSQGRGFFISYNTKLHRKAIYRDDASPLGNLKNFTRSMTLKASPLGNLKNFTRSMTLKASPLGNRWFERSEYPRIGVRE